MIYVAVHSTIPPPSRLSGQDLKCDVFCCIVREFIDSYMCHRVVTYDLSLASAEKRRDTLRRVWSGRYSISYYWHYRSATRREMEFIRSGQYLCIYIYIYVLVILCVLLIFGVLAELTTSFTV